MSERILLIGASSAIAQELARKLCQRGCHLILAGRQEEELESIALEFKGIEQSFAIQAESIEDAHWCLLPVLVLGQVHNCESDATGSLSVSADTWVDDLDSSHHKISSTEYLFVLNQLLECLAYFINAILLRFPLYFVLLLLLGL